MSDTTRARRVPVDEHLKAVARIGRDAGVHGCRQLEPLRIAPHRDFGMAREGRDLNTVFDTNGDLTACADVRTSGINPLSYYDLFGFREGRDPSLGFDTTAYLAANIDVPAAGIDPMQHYSQFGIYESRSAQGDTTVDVSNPLKVGWRRSPHPPPTVLD